MRVLVAPDSFKGTIGAADAAAALAAGWLAARPGDEVTCLPLADGGEGTVEVLAAAAADSAWHEAAVSGPGSAPVTARWLELPGGVHVIEAASAAGLPQLAVPDPLGAHTTGVGELLGRALDAGASQIVLGLGGVASTDGGTGALAALGARFLDAGQHELPRGGGALARLASADLAGLREPPPGGVTCLTDVRAPLLGSAGAAAVFGPQKGAGATQIAILDAGLTRLALVLGGDPGAHGAGAAGGAGYGFAAAWGAGIMPGAAELCRVAGLDEQLVRADLVLTGEGRYDATSADGKITGTVLAAAARAAVPAGLVAGVIAADPPRGVAAVALDQLAGGTTAAMSSPERWLQAAGRMLAADLGTPATSPPRPERPTDRRG
jgi:glycerate 2-kinase